MTNGEHTESTLGQHIEPEDLMLFLLEMLSQQERTAVIEHLESCPACHEELLAVRASLGDFALAATPEEEAPDGGRERMLITIGKEKAGFTPAQHPAAAVSSIADGRRPVSATLPGRVSRLAGWAAAAVFALVALHFYQDRETMSGMLAEQGQQIARLSADQARARELVDALTDRSAQRVTLSLTKAPAPPQPSGRATYIASRGTLIFVASHLDPLPAGKTYELWVIPANGHAPIPAGTFKPDEHGNASIVTARLEGAVAAKAFGVTIEAAGGSTTPTLPILLAGS